MPMSNISFMLLALLIQLVIIREANPSPGVADEQVEDSLVKAMFYNVENLFDIVDDSITLDEAFTPAGDMHWTSGRYYRKLNNISKVIIATGGWDPPDIIGLCEIENRKVLNDLVSNTPLFAFDYEIIHEDSPDRRGIDVALLINRRTIRLLHSRGFTVDHNGLVTRDILYASLKIGKDTCHLFVNHWPSRSKGRLETEKERIAVARVLKQMTDSLLYGHPDTRILIMGDFNDEPQDGSILETLEAKPETDPMPGRLCNLTSMPKGTVRGTLKYQGVWYAFDQIIVSGNMIGNSGGLSVKAGSFGVQRNAFLLVEDETYNGFKPFRTYAGFKYTGGFSDHLPVYIDLKNSYR
jgi:hypothetical protein